MKTEETYRCGKESSSYVNNLEYTSPTFIKSNLDKLKLQNDEDARKGNNKKKRQWHKQTWGFNITRSTNTNCAHLGVRLSHVCIVVTPSWYGKIHEIHPLLALRVTAGNICGALHIDQWSRNVDVGITEYVITHKASRGNSLATPTLVVWPQNVEIYVSCTRWTFLNRWWKRVQVFRRESREYGRDV